MEKKKSQSMEKRLLFLVGWVGCMSGTSLVYAQFHSGCVYPYYGMSLLVCVERHFAAHDLAILVSLSARDIHCHWNRSWLTFSCLAVAGRWRAVTSKKQAVNIKPGSWDVTSTDTSNKQLWNSTAPYVQWVSIQYIQYDTVQQTPREQGACMYLTKS